MLHSFQAGLLGSFGLCLPRLASCSLVQAHQAGECGAGHVSIIASFMCVGACFWSLHATSQTGSDDDSSSSSSSSNSDGNSNINSNDTNVDVDSDDDHNAVDDSAFQRLVS